MDKPNTSWDFSTSLYISNMFTILQDEDLQDLPDVKTEYVFNFLKKENIEAEIYDVINKNTSEPIGVVIDCAGCFWSIYGPDSLEMFREWGNCEIQLCRKENYSKLDSNYFKRQEYNMVNIIQLEGYSENPASRFHLCEMVELSCLDKDSIKKLGRNFHNELNLNIEKIESLLDEKNFSHTLNINIKKVNDTLNDYQEILNAPEQINLNKVIFEKIPMSYILKKGYSLVGSYGSLLKNNYEPTPILMKLDNSPFFSYVKMNLKEKNNQMLFLEMLSYQGLIKNHNDNFLMNNKHFNRNEMIEELNFGMKSIVNLDNPIQMKSFIIKNKLDKPALDETSKDILDLVFKLESEKKLKQSLTKNMPKIKQGGRF